MLKLTRGLVAIFCVAMFVAFALVACACSATSSSSGGGAESSSGSAASADAASSGESTDVELSSSSAATGDASATADSSESAGKNTNSASVGSTVTTDYPGPAFVNGSVATTPVETDIPEDSVLLFDDSSDSRALNSSMAAGKTPLVCNVWSNEEGFVLSIDVFDPDQIVQLYNLLSKMTVVGKSDMSVLDSGYCLKFELQNGLEVRYSFEDTDLLGTKSGNYAVQGGDELWSLVGQIQDEYLEKAETRGLRTITVAEDDEFITSYPREAVPGDLVLVNTMFVTDGFMHVTANGVEAENWGDFCFTFTMPDADVQLSSFSTPDGGLA